MSENNTIIDTGFTDRQGSNLNRRKLTIISQNPEEMIVQVDRADSDFVTVPSSPITSADLNAIITKINQLTTDVTEKTGTVITINGQAQATYELNNKVDKNTFETEISGIENYYGLLGNNLSNLINNETKITNSVGGAAFGLNANSTAQGAFQFGAGTNNTPNSLQIGSENIYDANSRTLKTQSISINNKWTLNVSAEGLEFVYNSNN